MIDMQQSFPKKTSEFYWTRHAGFKMRQYGLSEQRVKRVIKNPKRKEEGVAKDTVAVMQPISSKTIKGKEVWKQEVWVMFQNKVKSKNLSSALSLKRRGGIRIISAWRYPGVSPEKNPIPEEILRELGNIK
jgi:hypothetical protein